MSRFLIAPLLVVATTGCAAPAADVPAAPALQSRLDSLRELGIPGVVAEAVIDSLHIVARSGVADLQSRAPIPDDARFRAASNTKTFVAAAVLQLVGDGRVSLDDTVERWLPGLVTGAGNDGRRITVHDLLQHTSGLVDYTGDLPIRSAEDWEKERLRVYTSRELVAMSMRHAPAWLPEPGEARFSYSNVNYVLAGMVIEQVTGRTWEQEVEERIIRRLGLTGTSAPVGSTGIPEPHLRSYYQFGPDRPPVETTVFDPSVVGAAGSIISTTTDLNTFFRAVVTGKLLPPEQLTAMQQTTEAVELQELYDGARYGLGLLWRPLSCGGGSWGHVGEGAAGATRVGVTADGRRSIVLFMSTELTMPAPRRQQELLADRLIDDVLCPGSSVSP